MLVSPKSNQSQSRNQNHSTISTDQTHFHQKATRIFYNLNYNILATVERMSEYFIDHYTICVPKDCDDSTELSIEGKTRKLSITSGDLKIIPTFYPIDRTFKVIENTPADILSERLTKCFRIFNLAVNWDDQDPSRLCCSTNNFLKFEINLWKHDKKSSGKEAMIQNKKNDQNIILEIRRYDGDCVRFHRLKTSLFNFLCNPVGYNYNEDGFKEHKKSHMSRNISCTNIIHQIRPLALDNLMDVFNSVAMSYELIFNDNELDTVMGLNMLIFLTDSKSTHRVYAAHVSDFILLGCDPFGNNIPDVRDVIFNYVVNERNSIEHHYALLILANSFQNGTLEQEMVTDIQEGIEMWNTIIPSLILDIQDAGKSPHIAYNAVKCIKTWNNLAGSQADKSHTIKILSSLEKAILFGEQFYISLATESKDLKAILE